MAGDGSLFLVGGLDPGGFVTLDKPPAGLWLPAGMVRLFGFSSWTVVGPSTVWVVLGAAGVGWSSRRVASRTTGWVAGVLLLMTPGVVVLVRTNLPDAAMLGLAAAGLGLALGSGRWRVGAVLLGFAVLAKPTALLCVPAVAWAALDGVSGRWPRLGRVAVVGVVALVPLLVWGWSVEAMEDRPWVGGSSSDSVAEQLLGSGGAGRLVGAADEPGWREADAAIGTSSAGDTGLFRPVRGRMGQQVGWLIVPALIGGGAAWAAGEGRERRVVEAWGMWLVAHWLVYAWLPGLAHAYYAAMLAPPVVVLVVFGFPRLRESRPMWLLTVALTAVVSIGLVRSSPEFWPILVPLVVLAAVVAAARSVLSSRPVGPVEEMAATLGVGAALLVFGGSALLAERGPDFDPAAGPTRAVTALDLTGFVAPVTGDRSDGRWVVATGDELIGSRLMAEDGLSVMLVGGFRGRDPIVDEAALKDLLVREVVWALVSTRPDTPADELLLAVSQDCRRAVVLLNLELRHCSG